MQYLVINTELKNAARSLNEALSECQKICGEPGAHLVLRSDTGLNVQWTKEALVTLLCKEDCPLLSGLAGAGQ